MDGARVFRRRAGARTPHVEHEDRVAGAVHARNRAAGERMAGDQAPSLPLAFGRPRRPRRRADLSIARAPSRVTASRNSSSTMAEAAALAAASAASEGSGAGRRFSLSGGSGPCRKAILSTHRQPRCAFTRATITEALCCASSAKAPSTLSTSVAGTVGASGLRLAARGGHCSSIGRA